VHSTITAAAISFLIVSRIQPGLWTRAQRSSLPTRPTRPRTAIVPVRACPGHRKGMDERRPPGKPVVGTSQRLVKAALAPAIYRRVAFTGCRRDTYSCSTAGNGQQLRPAVGFSTTYSCIATRRLGSACTN
jgi:hypothetical protein